MEQNDRFLGRTFDRFLWPTILSVLGGTVNVMVDGILVGNLLGSDALAAINLCTPVYLLLCTLGSLIATGAGILSSVAVGRDGEEAARRHYTLAFRLLLLSGVLCSALGLVFLEPLLGLLGAEGMVLPLVRDYVGVTLAGGVFKLLLYLPFQYLRLDGRPKLVTGLLLTMTALNAGLDLLAMGPLGLGMAGAAGASVLATAVAALAGMAFLAQKESTFHLSRVPFHLGDVLDILRTGSPAALNNFLSAARLVLLNRILLTLGGSALVAVFTMVGGMSEFSLALSGGIPQTAGPLLGVYTGERDTLSIRRLMARQFKVGLPLSAAFGLVTAVAAPQICTVFGLTDPALAAIGAPALRIFALSLPFAMVLSILIAFYNTTGHIALSNLLTALRVFLFAVASAALLELSGSSILVWAFFPAAEVFSLALWPVLCALTRRGEHKLSRFYLLDETLLREGKTLNFSVDNTPEAISEASERVTDFCEGNSLSPKQTMAVSLSIEEMLVIIGENCFDGRAGESADLRIFCLPGTVGLRIRNGGRVFNPLAWYETRGESEPGDALGLKLITKLAQVVTYQRTFGVNTLIILLENGAEEPCASKAASN